MLTNGRGHATYLIPDILVFRTAMASRNATYLRPRDVQLVVDVVSPSTVTRHLVTKPATYAALGIPHYWLVETASPARVTTLAPGGDGTYVEDMTAGRGEVLRVGAPFEVSVSVESLLA